MLDAMSQIALDHLRHQLSGDAQGEHDPWEWYLRLREEHPQSLFPYLIEPARASMSPNYYAMRADPNDPDVAILEQRELREGDELRLPFVPSTGSQSGALGPVIKRTYNRQTGGSPSSKINETSLKDFEKIAASGEPWSDYFAYAASLFSRPKLRVRDELHDDGPNALNLAVREIPERQTSFLSVLDPSDRLPGEVEEYIDYLRLILATEKYSHIPAKQSFLGRYGSGTDFLVMSRSAVRVRSLALFCAAGVLPSYPLAGTALGQNSWNAPSTHSDQKRQIPA